MPLHLHLGVVDVPYVDKEAPGKQKARISRNTKKPRAKPKQPEANERTTGDVATILEAKYGLMEAFFENKEIEIMGFLEGSLGGTLENLLTGAPASIDPFGDATAKIEELFKDFISSYEAEHVGIDGTPTAAAKKGINHRFKHPYKKSNPRRPSFDDTGLLMSSFKAWMENR